MSSQILIAESDADMRDLYQRFFSNCGYTVETAGDGLTCLRKLAQFRPSALILDEHILWGGAAGVISLLRENRTLPQIPVVLIHTGSVPSTVDDYPPMAVSLQWPFRLDALLVAVRRALKKSPSATCEFADFADGLLGLQKCPSEAEMSGAHERFL